MRIRYITIVLCMMLPVIQTVAARSDSGHEHHKAQSRAWSSKPLLVKPGGRRTRGTKTLAMTNLDAGQLHVYPSVEDDKENASWDVRLDEGKAKIKSRGGKLGGYHWVTAREEHNSTINIASTLVYFSNPGPAPRVMLKQDKAELEIRPQRLPREHQHYRAKETWPFRLLYRGTPMPDSEVLFESKNGSRKVYKTNQAGLFEVNFPADFPVLDDKSSKHTGHHGRRKSDFVLSTELHQDGQHLISAFNYHYTPDAYADKDLTLGIGMAMLGMFAATPLLRTRKKKRNKGEQS